MSLFEFYKIWRQFMPIFRLCLHIIFALYWRNSPFYLRPNILIHTKRTFLTTLLQSSLSNGSLASDFNCEKIHRQFSNSVLLRWSQK